MKEELEKILTNLSDAGCGSEELQKAKQLYEAGDTEQRKVDCLDFLIRQTAKTNQ